VFTLIPLLTGEGRDHHGAILSEAARLIEAGQLRPRLDKRQYDLGAVGEAYDAITNRTADGKIVVSVD
jgi:NADPH:quinone reductase-like Zn-dependent oxidoreductase